MLKAFVLSRCLSNYRDLFNLCHLIRRWCSATHTFFLSCGEITVTLKDVANQLLLPILGDADLSNIELFVEEEAIEAKLRKGMSGNAKLSHWVGALPYYAIKLLCFCLAIKIFAGVSLPLVPMFLGHLYV